MSLAHTPSLFPRRGRIALEPLNRGKTSNVQHRTPNAEVSEDSRCHSMFGVGGSMLDGPLGSWGGRVRGVPATKESRDGFGDALFQKRFGVFAGGAGLSAKHPIQHGHTRLP